MERLFKASVSLTYAEERRERSITSPIASSTDFWWSETRPDERSLWESKIELGEKFFKEIIRHPVPLDLHVLKAMKRSSLGLDLYLWLTYRTFPLKAPMRLSWKALYRQFGVDPAKATDPRTVDNFRTDCLRELGKIKTAWPGLCTYLVCTTCLLLEYLGEGSKIRGGGSLVKARRFALFDLGEGSCKTPRNHRLVWKNPRHRGGR